MYGKAITPTPANQDNKTKTNNFIGVTCIASAFPWNRAVSDASHLIDIAAYRHSSILLQSFGGIFRHMILWFWYWRLKWLENRLPLAIKKWLETVSSRNWVKHRAVIGRECYWKVKNHCAADDHKTLSFITKKMLAHTKRQNTRAPIYLSITFCRLRVCVAILWTGQRGRKKIIHRLATRRIFRKQFDDSIKSRGWII